jgi:hypothetical protein
MTHTQDPAFPTTAEILAEAHKYVAENCGGVWPEDLWLSFSPDWAINLWIDDETQEQFVTAYPVKFDGNVEGTPDTTLGIRIPVTVNWQGEVAAIWARLYHARVEDALGMATALTTAEQRQNALKEFGEILVAEAEEDVVHRRREISPAGDGNWYFDAVGPLGLEPETFGPYATSAEADKGRDRLAVKGYRDFSVPYQPH